MQTPFGACATMRNFTKLLKNSRTLAYSFLSLLLLLMAAPRKANAYVDPGSGAMIWQVLAASVVGSLFYLRKAVTWIKARLGSRDEHD